MRIKKSPYPPATDQPAVWLLGLRPAAATPKRPKRLDRFRQWLHRWLSRIWPQRLTQNIGRLPDDTPVNLLELPYTKEEFRYLPLLQRRQQLQHALYWLTSPNKQTGGILQIDMPLNLQTLLPAAERPTNLADGWQLAAREFIRQMAAESGGLQAKQIAILGVEAASLAEQHICAKHCWPQAAVPFYMAVTRWDWPSIIIKNMALPYLFSARARQSAAARLFWS